MGKRQDKNDNCAGKAEAEAAKAPAGDPASIKGALPPPSEKPTSVAATSNLPMIESPKLGGGESAAAPGADGAAGATGFVGAQAMPMWAGEPARERPSESAERAAPHSRSFRFAFLAATIALAAGIGSFLGSLTAPGLTHTASAAIPRTADARAVVAALKVQLAELSGLKSNLEITNRNSGAQFAKISARLDSLERAQAAPAAKLTHIADALDRLDKRASNPDVTGSIAASPPTAPRPAGPSAAAPVLRDWIVQGVRNGRAMVESRYGGLFFVGSGNVLPGLGRVEAVKRQDGQWVVVTASGVIVSRP